MGNGAFGLGSEDERGFKIIIHSFNSMLVDKRDATIEKFERVRYHAYSTLTKEKKGAEE